AGDGLEPAPRPARRASPPDFGGKDDFQLAQAIRHLKGQPVRLAALAAPARGTADPGAIAVPAGPAAAAAK
ncbi:hypothetical protein C7C56_005015, partial [Massilia glaciei]